MRASHFDFVDVVLTHRDLVVTRADDHVCRLEPRVSGLKWYCDLDDGTPIGESDPAAFVRWVCPELRVGCSATGMVPQLDVRRLGARSDLARLVKTFGRLLGRRAGAAPDGRDDARYAYTDPAAILDVDVRRLIEHWPAALHGDGVVRPAELLSITLTGEGLTVESVSWWGSAPVLDHQIGLALDIAHRLKAHRKPTLRPGSGAPWAAPDRAFHR